VALNSSTECRLRKVTRLYLYDVTRKRSKYAHSVSDEDLGSFATTFGPPGTERISSVAKAADRRGCSL
jgi:hypothetical protein